MPSLFVQCPYNSLNGFEVDSVRRAPEDLPDPNVRLVGEGVVDGEERNI